MGKPHPNGKKNNSIIAPRTALEPKFPKRILIYAVYKKLIYKRIKHSRLEDINYSELININAYMSSSSTYGPEQHTVTVKTLNERFYNYYCFNIVNLELHNIHVRDSNFITMADFNSHSQSWGYGHIDA